MRKSLEHTMEASDAKQNEIKDFLLTQNSMLTYLDD